MIGGMNETLSSSPTATNYPRTAVHPWHACSRFLLQHDCTKLFSTLHVLPFFPSLRMTDLPSAIIARLIRQWALGTTCVS